MVSPQKTSSKLSFRPISQSAAWPHITFPSGQQCLAAGCLRSCSGHCTKLPIQRQAMASTLQRPSDGQYHYSGQAMANTPSYYSVAKRWPVPYSGQAMANSLQRPSGVQHHYRGQAVADTPTLAKRWPLRHFTTTVAKRWPIIAIPALLLLKWAITSIGAV